MYHLTPPSDQGIDIQLVFFPAIYNINISVIHNLKYTNISIATIYNMEYSRQRCWYAESVINHTLKFPSSRNRQKWWKQKSSDKTLFLAGFIARMRCLQIIFYSAYFKLLICKLAHFLPKVNIFFTYLPHYNTVFKGVDPSLCVHPWYNMHYTTAKVILVFHVQDIMNNLLCFC